MATQESQKLLAPGASVAEPGVLVEAFFNRRRQLKLLVSFPPGSDPHVNGEPAPQRVVLEAGDFLQLGVGIGFHLTVFSKPQVGPPPAVLLGKPCPVCSVDFTAETSCYTCGCGTALHCEAAENGLQCAQLRGECPRCNRPVLLKEAYASIPSQD